jgi:hypothetical protein
MILEDSNFTQHMVITSSEHHAYTRVKQLGGKLHLKKGGMLGPYLYWAATDLLRDWACVPLSWAQPVYQLLLISVAKSERGSIDESL